jgi:hypothetical protein
MANIQNMSVSIYKNFGFIAYLFMRTPASTGDIFVFKRNVLIDGSEQEACVTVDVGKGVISANDIVMSNEFGIQIEYERNGFIVDRNLSLSPSVRVDRPHYRQIEKTKFKNKAWK